MNIYDDLVWRGLVAESTHPEDLRRLLQDQRITVYAGFDPTADSLHIGNLVPLLTLRRFQLCGHSPIAVAGGATGLIGDPSGRTSERQLMNTDVLARNLGRIKDQLARLLDFGSVPNPALLLDNAAWIGPISFLDFLRDVGKHFSINVMIGKESVRARMEDREGGISFTEFSYMLIQAFDYFELSRTRGCQLQIGGNDQWGNITAGIDLCRKKAGKQVFGLTVPLITNADGSKFGKSVAGSVWLDPEKTSVYRFYQYWMRVDDRDVIRYLKFFTFLSHEEITALEQEHFQKPELRIGQKVLAKQVTEMIHGLEAANEAIRASEILFGGGLAGITEATFQEIRSEIPAREIEPEQTAGKGMSLLDLLVLTGLSSSKGQARKDVEGGGVYVNNVREADVQRMAGASDFLFGKHLLLRKGKRNYVIVTVKSTAV